jgi:hypothetical protein
MFNLSHIDKLIFDDENYTKSKLYFWAYQSLELIQQQVTTIIRRWAQYRSHVDLNHPGRTARKRKATAYNARLEELFNDMDLCIEDFREFVKDCKAKQHEIAALRDGVSTGSCFGVAKILMLMNKAFQWIRRSGESKFGAYC